MIKRRNLDPSLRAEMDGLNGLSTKYGLGNIWYVDVNAGGSTSGAIGRINSAGDGSEWDKAQTSLANAFTNMGQWDMILLAPGNYTGNYDTPINATAPFCSLIGMRSTSLGLAVWAGATTSTTPIITVKARGWRISGIEFDNPSSSWGVELNKSSGSSPNRPDYTEIDNCLFTRGQGGINFNGGATYFHFHDNRFDFMSGSTSREDGGIVVSDSSEQLPGVGLVEDNIFMENIFHIACGASWGFNSSIIKRNVFMGTGKDNTATKLCDMRGGTGTQILDNYFGCTISQYNSGTLVYGGTSGRGMGNMCIDGFAGVTGALSTIQA